MAHPCVKSLRDAKDPSTGPADAGDAGAGEPPAPASRPGPPAAEGCAQRQAHGRRPRPYRAAGRPVRPAAADAVLQKVHSGVDVSELESHTYQRLPHQAPALPAAHGGGGGDRDRHARPVAVVADAERCQVDERAQGGQSAVVGGPFTGHPQLGGGRGRPPEPGRIADEAGKQFGGRLPRVQQEGLDLVEVEPGVRAGA